MSLHDDIKKMAIDQGMLFLASGSSSDTKSWALVIRENTIITSWVDEDDVDLVAKMKISGKTLFVTDPPLIIGNDKKSKELTLASGSVWEIL